MAKTNIAHRRKLRELEAKRDKLLETAAKVKQDMATTRAAIKAHKKTR